MDQLFTLYLHVVETHIVLLLDLAAILALSEAIGGPNEVQLAVKWANKGLNGGHDANYRALLAAKSVTKLAMLEKCNVQLFNTQKFLIILSSDLTPLEIIRAYIPSIDLMYVFVEIMINNKYFEIIIDYPNLVDFVDNEKIARKYNALLLTHYSLNGHMPIDNNFEADMYVNKEVCERKIAMLHKSEYYDLEEHLKKYHDIIWPVGGH
jgi:hypothetical protein